MLVSNAQLNSREMSCNKLARMRDEELLLLRASLRAEMRKRGIADSVGAVGEQLAIEHFRKTPGLAKLQLAHAARRTWTLFPATATKLLHQDRLRRLEDGHDLPGTR